MLLVYIKKSLSYKDSKGESDFDFNEDKNGSVFNLYLLLTNQKNQEGREFGS